jgi:multidrug transporter EmrE-like cation transporter
MSGWLMLAFSIVCNVGGNLLVKTFSARNEIRGLRDYLSPTFCLGIAVFGLGVLFYGKALRQIPIVVAYPVQVGASVLVITLVAVAVFGERFGLQALFGILLVMSGILVLSRVQ